MTNKGLFLSLDGLDGAGKSTQCDLLARWLLSQSYSVTQCIDPGGTEVGQHIRKLLLNETHELSLTCEMLLFMASRAQLTDDVIKPALDAGQVVISDRYLLANIVYQGYAGGLDPEQLRTVGAIATSGLQPDLTFVLDLPLADAVKRRKQTADRMERRDDDYHERVRQGFLTEAKRQPERMIVVDANRPEDAIQADIRTHFTSYLERTRE